MPDYEPTAEISSVDHGIEPIALSVHDLGGGAYHLPVDIPIAGRWIVTVDVRTSTFETGTAQLEFEVG